MVPGGSRSLDLRMTGEIVIAFSQFYNLSFIMGLSKVKLRGNGLSNKDIFGKYWNKRNEQ